MVVKNRMLKKRLTLPQSAEYNFFATLAILSALILVSLVKSGSEPNKVQELSHQQSVVSR
jgi:hypothetical protein